MTTPNVDPAEIVKFSALASHWWDEAGDLRTLHAMNPLRLNWINDRVQLNEKKAIDIGCGGGILTESMAKLGALVTGLDLSKEAIQVAELHQHESNLKIEYLVNSAELVSQERQEQYDVVTCLEMLEHVPDPASIISACAALVKPGGDVFFSTLNRNLKSYVQAIIGAEYLLKLLPQQTHDYHKFIRPAELANWARQANLNIKELTGVQYHLLTKQFSLTKDISVNYLVHLKK